MSDMREETAILRDINRRLESVVRNYRILAAVRLLESGRASSWLDALRLARLSGSPSESED